VAKVLFRFPLFGGRGIGVELRASHLLGLLAFLFLYTLKLFENNLSLTNHPHMLPAARSGLPWFISSRNAVQACQTPRNNLSIMLQLRLCECGWSYKPSAGMRLLEAWHLPFIQPDFPFGVGAQHGSGLQWAPVVHSHSCFINFPEPHSASFTTLCVICYRSLGYKLDSDFDYVYGWASQDYYYSKLSGLLPELSLLLSQ
jgi:hypothetical protein